MTVYAYAITQAGISITAHNTAKEAYDFRPAVEGAIHIISPHTICKEIEDHLYRLLKERIPYDTKVCGV